MRYAVAVASVFVVLLAACSRDEPAADAVGAAERGGAALEPAPGGPAVVLELFTSQGCSSCPPADATLSRLGRDEGLRGRVVPLAFHVDYWNYIGWADPFSSPEWSARQRAYSPPLGLDGVYTPQLVVNGRAHLNGSDESGIRELIAEASRAPAARVSVETERAGDGFAVRVRAELPERLDAGRLRAVVVLFENGVATEVRRGENRGRTLANDYVVRRLEEAFELGPEAGARGEGRVTFAVDPSWRAEHLGVAAFLQDPETMRIHGAAVR